jgi:hypothetical protein
METMNTQNNTTTKTENATYETLGEPATILTGKQGFIEVAHRRALFADGSHRDFVLIARGYITRQGAKRTQRLVTIPAEHAAAVARVLAPGGAELRNLADVARELEA